MTLKVEAGIVLRDLYEYLKTKNLAIETMPNVDTTTLSVNFNII
jgi:hypothetical protein